MSSSPKAAAGRVTSSMLLDGLPTVGADPILSGVAAFERDTGPNKVDLGIGVYRDEDGRSGVLACVKQAEHLLLQEQVSKAYLSSEGNPAFNDAVQALLLGPSLGSDARVRTVQTPGASGALRIAAEFIRRYNAEATMWVPVPTWGNHEAIAQAGGLKVRRYRYYDTHAHRLCYEDLLADLAAVVPGDVVLIHGCCHNPSGADLDATQWSQLLELLERRDAVPLVDIAYQGFAAGIDEDARGIRLLAQALPFMLIANSCSKNFGLYRERTGTLSIVAADRQTTERTHAHVLQLIRAMYSMPPDHGAAVVARILVDPQLREHWHGELTAMRRRIKSIRELLAKRLTDAGLSADCSYLAQQNGMFSLLDLAPREVERLRTEFHVHLIPSGRINIAALSHTNVSQVADAITAVVRGRRRSAADC
jgi:aspartate aminotransferase